MIEGDSDRKREASSARNSDGPTHGNGGDGARRLSRITRFHVTGNNVGDVDTAKAMLSSEDLKQKMTDAGVTSPPTIFFGRSA